MILHSCQKSGEEISNKKFHFVKCCTGKRCEDGEEKSAKKGRKGGLQRGVKRAEYIPGAQESARAEEAAEGRG